METIATFLLVLAMLVLVICLVRKRDSENAEPGRHGGGRPDKTNAEKHEQ